MKKLLTLVTILTTLEAEALSRVTFQQPHYVKEPIKQQGEQQKERKSIPTGPRVASVKPTQNTPKPQPQIPKVETSEKSEILEYADSGVGSPYVWGGSKWSTTNRKVYGADCSGFAQKSWGYPSRLKTNESIPGGKRLNTANFIKAQDAGYPWTRLDNMPYSQSQPGDAMVYRKKGNGHIFLVSKTDNSGVVTLEARGKKYGIGYARKSYAYLKNKGYKTIRKK